MKQGKIVELGERNSGLIKLVGVKDTLFFHSDALEGVTFGELKAGDKVKFDVTESKKGPYAINVHRS
ncbi:MAG: cold shock domain-containing protein [Patescibacteria group bacterium]